MTRALVAIALLVPGVAAAQSTRYPPPEPDADEEEDSYSDFWENAVEPGRGQYDDLVDRAAKALARRSEESRRTAIELLDEATALLPGHTDAWAWLGLAYEAGLDYAPCRDALERAWALDPTWEEAPRPLGLALGVCRGRAGDLDGAAEVLERLVAHGDVRVETLWRLGEVDIATGRLDDAQTVLGVALDQSPADAFYPYAAWALAVAADRARDPEATLAAAEVALRLDPERYRASDPPSGFLVPGERAYYMGLAAAMAKLPERALLHFRRYVDAEVEGPWVERAREHVRALDDVAPSKRVEQVGSEKVDLTKAAAVIAKIDPQLRKCMKATPHLLVQLRVTLHAPPPAPPPTTPPAKKSKKKGKQPKPAPVAARPKPPPRRSASAPPEGAHGVTLESYEADPAMIRDAIACVDKLASGLALPAPQTAGTWVTITAPVIWR